MGVRGEKGRREGGREAGMEGTDGRKGGRAIYAEGGKKVGVKAEGDAARYAEKANRCRRAEGGVSEMWWASLPGVISGVLGHQIGNDLLAKVLVDEAGARQLGLVAAVKRLLETPLVVVEAHLGRLVRPTDVDDGIHGVEYGRVTRAGDGGSGEGLRPAEQEACERLVAVKGTVVRANSHLPSMGGV